MAERWFLNNNIAGAAGAAQKYASSIDAKALFVYKPEELERMYGLIDRANAGEQIPVQDYPLDVPTRAVLLLVEHIRGRVPVKDIVEVSIYPPFDDVAQQALSLAGLHAALDVANSGAS